MADYDLKSITPKASVAADTEFLFGAADQSSGTPIPYAFSIIKTWVKAWLAKGDVGLGNVDNTSDATKNAASVTLTNKTMTSPVINTPTGIVKGDVGLGNVDNTSDATKNAASVTLTNKTLTSPVINTPTGIVKGDVGLGSVLNSAQLVAASNLSDVANAATSRTNLGLVGTGATQYPFYPDATVGVGPMVVGTPASLTLTNQRLYLVPFIVPESKTFVSLSINVVTREAAKGIRLGLYNSNATTRQPTTLIVDAGIVDLDTGTGVVNKNTKTISQLLAPGLYYAAFLSNGTGTAVISGLGTVVSYGALGYALSSGGTITPIAGHLLVGQTYQAFATALSDLSGLTFTPVGAGLPFFVLN